MFSYTPYRAYKTVSSTINHTSLGTLSNPDQVGLLKLKFESSAPSKAWDKIVRLPCGSTIASAMSLISSLGILRHRVWLGSIRHISFVLLFNELFLTLLWSRYWIASRFSTWAVPSNLAGKCNGLHHMIVAP